MSEEQKLILDMLSQGKITVEEAQGLLESMGKTTETTDSENPPERGDPKSIVDDIVDTIRSGLSNINLSFGEAGRIVLEERHSGRFVDDRAELELDVRNGSIRIETWDEDEYRLDIIKKIRAGTREQAEELISRYRFADFDGRRLRAGDQECKGLGGRINVSLRLLLPRKKIYFGKVASKNGSVEVNGIDMSGFDIRTMNGSVKLNKVTGDKVITRTVNGSLHLEGGLGKVEAKTTNGSITFLNIAEDSEARLETVNGRIAVQLPVRSGIGLSVNAKTTSGRVVMNHPILVTRFEEKRVGGRSVEATTDNWKTAEHHIVLQLRSVNGSIRIEELV